MNIKKRLLPAALIVIVTVGCILLCRPTRLLFFAALAVAAAFEMESVLGEAAMPFCKWHVICYIAAQCLMCWLRVGALWMIALFALMAFVAMFCVVLRPELGGKYAVTGIFVLVWPFSFFAIVLHAAASDIWLSTLAVAILGAWALSKIEKLLNTNLFFALIPFVKAERGLSI